ncbi:MAG: ABC transporter ATP-binding protein [Deltaproteobacteria bacterium]|nr:ABC transporter ATP-binding protein [Deltaproteobacteria bacterium]
MTMALLEAVGLSKHYRHNWTLRPIRVLEDVSISLRPGEVFGLIGPNGAGKTTTVKLMLGLLRPSRGQVLFDGLPVTLPRARSRMGFLPEQPYFYDYLTVDETLHFYAQLAGVAGAERRRRVAALVERLQLGPFLRRTMRQLSKGNLQRVGIAQAIIHRPQLAILDEPMSGLDPTGRKEMRDLIAELHDEGMTVIFSSHILPDTEALCDRVAILVAGRVREVVEMARSGEAAGPFALTASALPAAVLPQLQQLGHQLGGSASGPQWSFRLPDRPALQRAVALIAAANGFVESITPEQPSLEERYLAYVGDATPSP